MLDVQTRVRGQIFWRNDSRDATPGIITKSRPVILVSNNFGLAYSQVATVIPITSQPRKSPLPTHVQLSLDNKTTNWALCEQITTINVSELGEYICTVCPAKMDEINDALSKAVGLMPLEADVAKVEVEVEKPSTEDSQVAIETAPTKKNRSSLTRKSRRWSDNEKIQLLLEYSQVGDDVDKLSKMVTHYDFKNVESMMATIRRFRKQAGG